MLTHVDELINTINNTSLPRITRLKALNAIVNDHHPSALKQLLMDMRFINAIVLDVHDRGSASPMFWMLMQVFELNDD